MAQGGLPHLYLKQAFDLLQRTTPLLVTCPILPYRSLREQEYVQSAAGFPGLVIEQEAERAYVDRTNLERDIDRLSLAYLQDDVTFAALKTEDAPLLMDWLHRIEQGGERRALKCQVVGPISLGLQLTDDQQRPLIYDPMLHEALAQHLVLRVSWLATQIGKLTSDVIVCLDEPFLDAFGSPFCPLGWDDGAALLEMVLKGITGCRGLFTSSSIDWGRLLETSVELVHFNAYTYGSSLLAAAALLPDFFERSGVLVWGIVPADESMLHLETATTLRIRFEGFLDELVAVGVSRDQILASALISTNGSLAELSIDMAEQAMMLCAELSAQLRLKYRLE